MRHNKIIIYFILLLFIGTGTMTYAVNPAQHERWMNNLRNYKRDFLIKELDLSSKQQDEFFPLYNNMEQEIYVVNKEARELEHKISTSSAVTDDEYERVAEKMLSVKSQEAQIENTFYQKFSKILSKKQLFKLQRAETRFSRNMLQHHKEAQRRSH